MAPLPTVARRVLAIVGDPEYKIDSLVHIVRTDPALTGRILKLTGSALFALENEITSVGQAVVFIGTRNLVKLVMLSCSEGSFASVRFQDLYNQLTASATTSADALQAGVTIEQTDIADLEAAKAAVAAAPDVSSVYSHLITASQHHLQAFGG